MTDTGVSDIVLRRIPGECANFVLSPNPNRVVYYDQSIQYRLASNVFSQPPNMSFALNQPSSTTHVYQEEKKTHQPDHHPLPESPQLFNPVQPQFEPEVNTAPVSVRDENFIPPPGFFDKGGPKYCSDVVTPTTVNGVYNFIECDDEQEVAVDSNPFFGNVEGNVEGKQSFVVDSNQFCDQNTLCEQTFAINPNQFFSQEEETKSPDFFNDHFVQVNSNQFFDQHETAGMTLKTITTEVLVQS